MPSVIGVDLGGTKIAAARYDADSMELQEEKKAKTHSEMTFNKVIEDMATLIQQIKTDDTTAIGVGVPGLVRQPAGIVLTMPNIPGAKDIPLKAALHEAIGMPTFIDNDANCFALAEATEGAGMGHSIVVGITLGTGVGGGIVIDGKIYQGANGFAAEVGHMLLKPGEPPYETDDKRGDVEQFISGTAFGKRCEAAQNPQDYLEGDVCAFMWPDVYEEVAWMCVNLIHVLDPSVIIFGGSAGRSFIPHIPKVNNALKQWTLPGTPLPPLEGAKLEDSATRGAAMLTSG